MTTFLLHCGITALSLWAASYVFQGIKFANMSSMVISALLLGFVNAILRPLFSFGSCGHRGQAPPPLNAQNPRLSLGCSPAIAGDRATRECAFAKSGSACGTPAKSTLLTRRM